MILLERHAGVHVTHGSLSIPTPARDETQSVHLGNGALKPGCDC